jgi:hypothetical protein
MDIVVLLNVSFMDAVNDSIMCIISLNCLPVTKSSSSFSGSCCSGCFLGGMVSGIEKRSSRRLGISKEEPKIGGITHSLKRLTPASYPALTSVLHTLQVATGGHEGN